LDPVKVARAQISTVIPVRPNATNEGSPYRIDITTGRAIPGIRDGMTGRAIFALNSSVALSGAEYRDHVAGPSCPIAIIDGNNAVVPAPIKLKTDVMK